MSFAWKGFHSFGGGFSPSFGPSLTGGVTPIGSWDASTSTLAQLAALATHSRTSLATMFDSTGKLTYAPNNLLLNTATLGTQTVTVQVGVNYILSIKGTGSVTLTGASTAGPLNGTGASNRVDLKITAATSSLTLTVSGSVTSARLSAVTYETAFRAVDDVDNTASAYYGPRIDYDPNTLAVKGLLIEEARTNLAIQSAALTGTGWAAASSSKGSDATVDLTGATALKLTATAATATHHLESQTANISVTSGTAYTQSWYAKAGTHSKIVVNVGAGANWAAAVFDISGTANLAATQTASALDTSVSGTAFYMGGGWFRLTLTFTASATGARYSEIGFAPALTGNTFSGFGEISFAAAGTETFYVGQPQTEPGSFATSYIPDAAAAVTRAADALAAATYSSNPAILQVRNLSTGARSRKKLTTYSSISSEINEWIEAIRVYPVGTSSAYLDAHLTVDGPW